MKTTCKTLAVSLMIVGQFAVAQSFMTEEEMLNTFPGATVTGISANDGRTKWTQTYDELKKGKTKGKGKGVFGKDPYKFSWRTKKGKWCENWVSGRACWDMERIDEKTIRIYKKGKLINTWTIM